MKIAFLIPYPTGRAASQRFRFEQYLDILRNEGHEVWLQSFLDEGTWDILYTNGRWLKKTIGLCRGFFRRWKAVFKLSSYNYVFIHREASPVGPPIFEYIIARILRKKIIFDLDDAIWIPNSSDHNRFFSFLKWHSNAFAIARMAYRISAGNRFLAKTLEKYNKNIVINPTTIDTEGLHKSLVEQGDPNVVVGWTGSHSTIKYLEAIFPIISELKGELDFTFIVISDEAPDWDNALYNFMPWKKETEMSDLMQFNIGIMPLSRDPWSEGKCGFKALQYLALGIPAVVSPVGVNEDIVQDGVNGFVCKNDEDWKVHLKELITDATRRKDMGQAGRRKVIEEYSVLSNGPNFLHLFA